MAKRGKQNSKKTSRPRSSYNYGGPVQPGTPYTAAASTTGVAMPTPNIPEESPAGPFQGLTRARTMEYAKNAGNQAMLQQELTLAKKRLQNNMIYRPVATIRNGEIMEIGPEDPYHPKHQQYMKDQRLVNPMSQLSFPKSYSQGGSVNKKYTKQSKNYWANSKKKKMAVGGAYTSVNPLNPQGYSDNVYMEGQGDQMMNLSDSTQRQIKRRQVGRDIGATAYGALEGLVDTVTFGLTDKLTDKGYNALSNMGRTQTEAQRARNERWRTSGQLVGGAAGAALTGGSATGSFIGTTDIENFANEESQGLQQGLKVAGQVAGMAVGSTGSGMGTFDGTAAGDALGKVQGMSQYGGEGNALQNLYGASGQQGTQMYNALGKIGEGGGKEAIGILLQQAMNNPQVAQQLNLIPQNNTTQTPAANPPAANQPIGTVSNTFGLNPTFGNQQSAPGTTLNMPASANMQLQFANGGYKKRMAPGGPTDPPKEEFLSKAIEKRDIDYMPSIQPQQLDRINSSVRSKNPYFGDKGNTYLPLDFYYDWLNSSMYKDMMDGKESIHDKVKPIPSSIYKDDEGTTQEFLQKFGYRPGLNGKLSVTDARKQNLENTKIENFEVSDYNNMALRGRQTTEYTKDSEGNRIGEFPQIQMQNPKFKYSSGAPSMSFDEYLTTLLHEYSHASDADIIRYKASPSFYTSSAPEYYEYWGKPAPEGTFGLGERDETGGSGKDLIPTEDLNLIKSFVEKNKEENLKGHYPEFSRNREWNWKYFTKPTEVRARLNSQRYDLFRKGLFNPFTQKMTQDRLDKIREATIKSGSKDMKDLFNFFSDDQIIEMFNSIAMEKNIQEYPDGVQTAAYGGSIKKFASGGDTDPPRNGLPSFNPQITSTQAVRDNTQTPAFEDPYVRAQKIAAAEQQQGLNFQNRVKEYVLANNPEATPEQIDQAIAQTAATGKMPEYIQPQGQYQTYGSSGQALGTQTFATDPKVRAAQKAYNDKYGFSPKEYSPINLLEPMAQGYRGIQAGPVAADRGYLTNNEYNIDIPGSVIAADFLLPFAPGLARAGVKGLKAIPGATRQGLRAAQSRGFLTPNTPDLTRGLTLYSGIDPRLIRNVAGKAIGRLGQRGAAFEPLLQINPSATTKQAMEISKSLKQPNVTRGNYLNTDNINALMQVRGGFAADEVPGLIRSLEEAKQAGSLNQVPSIKGNTNLAEDLAGFRGGNFEGLSSLQKKILAEAEDATLASKYYGHHLLDVANSGNIDAVYGVAGSIASNPVMTKSSRSLLSGSVGDYFRGLGATDEEINALMRLTEYNIPVTAETLQKVRLQKAIAGTPGYQVYVPELTLPPTISSNSGQFGLNLNPQTSSLGFTSTLGSAPIANIDNQLLSTQNRLFAGYPGGAHELIPMLARKLGQSQVGAAKEMQTKVIGNLDNIHAGLTDAQKIRGVDDLYMTNSLSGQSYPLATKIVGSNKLPRHLKTSNFGARDIQVKPSGTASLNSMSFYRQNLGNVPGAQLDLLAANESIINAKKFLKNNYGIDMPYALPGASGTVKAPILKFNVGKTPTTPTTTAGTTATRTSNKAVRSNVSTQEQEARSMMEQMGLDPDMPMPDTSNFNFDFANGGLVPKKQNSYLNLYRR